MKAARRPAEMVRSVALSLVLVVTAVGAAEVRPAPTEEQLREFAQRSMRRAEELQGKLILYDEEERSNRDFRFVELTDEPPRRVAAERWTLSAIWANPRNRRFVVDVPVERDGGTFRLGRSRIRGPEGKPRYHWVLRGDYWVVEEGPGESSGSSEDQGERQGKPRR